MANLKLIGYEKFESGNPSKEVGSYTVQLNPENLSLSFGESSKKDKEPKSAVGMTVSDKTPAYPKRTLSISFIIDNTGAIPSPPAMMYLLNVGGSIKDSIDQLLKVTVIPTNGSHRAPFVKLIWGQYSLVGVVKNLNIKYTYFNDLGDAVRAEISFNLEEEVDEAVETREFQSPDITRIVTVKDGDQLISMCASFYDDPKYYLEVAKYNNLPSFRGLKMGSKIEFPPLEK